MLRLPQTSPKEMSERHLFPELKIASEGLKHRVFEAHLQNDEDNAYRKIRRLRAEHVQGKHVLTQFWGMGKLRSLVNKCQTLILVIDCFSSILSRLVKTNSLLVPLDGRPL